MCRKPLGCGVLRSVVIEDENLEGHSKDDDDENDVEDEEEWGQRGEEEMESDGEAEEAGQEAETEVESRANENAPLGGNGDLRQRRQSGLKDACVRAALQ